jgi:hypothetical protein
VLARRALEAAIRNDDDLLGLLPPVGSATSRPQHAVAMSALPPILLQKSKIEQP